MQRKVIVLLTLLFMWQVASGSERDQDPTDQDPSYQERQKIDLGALTIDGEIVGPGDFSIEDEKARESKFLYKRKNHNDRLRINIQYVF